MFLDNPTTRNLKIKNPPSKHGSLTRNCEYLTKKFIKRVLYISTVGLMTYDQRGVIDLAVKGIGEGGAALFRIGFGVCSQALGHRNHGLLWIRCDHKKTQTLSNLGFLLDA
jgi:hypothetical protein